MKFSDLSELSRKDAEDNNGVDALKKLYLNLVEKQKESVNFLKNVIAKKFDYDLKAIFDNNVEVEYSCEDGVFYIQFGGGNITLEVHNQINNDVFSVKKKIMMKRGDKTDFKFIELCPIFPYGLDLRIKDSFVAPISQGVNLDIAQIQDMKHEIKLIERNIENFSSVPKLLYYVYKGSKDGNGKINENENLELMLDQAVATTTLFK